MWAQQHTKVVPAKKMKHCRNRLRTNIRPLICLAAIVVLFALFSVPMGLANALNTMMNTAYRLLMDTAFYIMALAVITGAISAVFAEYGVVELLNKALSPVMRPLYGMPGAASIGIVTTYLSDNPAILTLAHDRTYRRFFRQYQIPALTNLGTSFGMGLIVTAFVLGIDTGDGINSSFFAALCGNLGAVCGSVVSTRLMLFFTAAGSGKDAAPADIVHSEQSSAEDSAGKGGTRLLTTMMDGGKTGVELGMAIIPGLLIICTLIMMLTGGPSDSGQYTGAAYEGIALLPALAEKIDFLLKPLFGFSSGAAVAVPVTALGSAGAALGIIPRLVASGQAGCGDLAVFTAMCMCWSGYLSTHVSMMAVLGSSDYTGKAILSHTAGGLCAGIAAHWLYVLVQSVF